MRILVTGGAGFIGSHACVELLQAGHGVVVLDNLSNGSVIALDRVRKLTGRDLRFVHGDVRSPENLHDAFQDRIDAVIHFAALKAVAESCVKPLVYFDNNITGTISLLQAMDVHGVHRLVFSSSATVYGQPAYVPVDEDAQLGVTNPYGRSKLAMEGLIEDWCTATTGASAVLLRYFNPVGAHPSGVIGEDPNGLPNNLMPYIAQVAVGRQKCVRVFGDDYPTPDGTGVRDYLHVVDLVDAHVKALDHACRTSGCHVFNLGCGRGHSVLELIRAFEQASGKKVPYVVTGRRAGDVAELWADVTRAQNVLGWRASRGLEEMCLDSWRWQSQNPNGYIPC